MSHTKQWSYYMRNSCEGVKRELKSQTVLELHRGCQLPDVHSISDFVETSVEKENEEFERVSSFVNLRFVQKLLNEADVKKHRTSFCCNRQFSVCSSTRLLDNGKSTNIYHCNHNSCSVCSKKLYKDKHREIRKAFKYVKRNNRNSSFHIMTLTISHKREDKLEERIRTISDMKRKLMAHKVIKNLNLIFYHSTLEIVYGKSGWHPHYHIMLSKDGDITMDESDLIGKQWKAIGKTLGVHVDLKKGFDIGSTDCLDAAATYLSKSQELKDLGKKLADEVISDIKKYSKNESFSIQQLIGLAASGRWNDIPYSRFKVEQLILEYLQVKNINYFRGCQKWNQIVKLSADENIDDDKDQEKDVKKFIEISSKAYIELLKHDLLLGSERIAKDGKILEYEGILKEHRRNDDIEDTWGYLLWILETKENELYSGIKNDIRKVVVNDKNQLEQNLSFSNKGTVYRFSLDSIETELAIAA
jgi:hypothetical protein